MLSGLKALSPGTPGETIRTLEKAMSHTRMGTVLL